MNNLKVDWNFKPEENQRQGIITMEMINKLIPECNSIICIVNTRQDLFSGELIEVSPKIISIKTRHPFSYFKEGDEIRVKFNIFVASFNIKGIIRNIDLDRLDIDFKDLRAEEKAQLVSLFSSYFLQYKLRG